MRASTAQVKKVYEIYKEAVGGETYDGKPMPEFEGIAGSALKGWGAVADYAAGERANRGTGAALIDALFLMWRAGMMPADLSVLCAPAQADEIIDALKGIGCSDIPVMGDAEVRPGNFYVSVRHDCSPIEWLDKDWPI